MDIKVIDDRAVIERFLRRNTALSIYQIGDLDHYYWSNTKWYGLVEQNDIQALVLLYTGLSTPTLLALCDDDGIDKLRTLIDSVHGLLPAKLYCHLTPGVESSVAVHYQMESHGEHYKMTLTRPEMVKAIDTHDVVPLDAADSGDLLEFYGIAYPDNWYDPRMLGTGEYFGIHDDGALVAAAGVHVFSPQYRVAALGNIATHPKCRRRGYGAVVTAAVCQSLLKKVDQIGLNVAKDNKAAIACYHRLGFEPVVTYLEIAAIRKQGK